MVQTAHQRLANDRFARQQERLMGKPELRSKLEERKKAPVNKTAVPTWLLYTLLALLVGGLFLEPLRLFISWLF
ncbi:Protein of unknown function [Pyronema omphalodes CBS 100304]|uniref:Uncharacterized protein n=1 Tax=Pyronema omphalodes (strain CBS 100304) TaxID=1076935 RepID=U4LR89_PYROM|nr:Protein of unknown function [Pyronema omphalodes CBS 100304]